MYGVLWADPKIAIWPRETRWIEVDPWQGSDKMHLQDLYLRNFHVRVYNFSQRVVINDWNHELAE